MLLKRGILHRDISPQNILAGKPGAQQGDRGVLIDLDLAIRYPADGVDTPADWWIVSALSSLVS
jgi:serine/threonine protein kinase